MSYDEHKETRLRLAEAYGETVALRSALREIVNVLGPEQICTCPDGCDGLRYEAEHALEVAKKALA